MIDPDGGFEPPVNPIPPAIILLTLAIVLVEGALSLAEAGVVGGPRGLGWRLAALQDYGFSPAVLDWMITRSDYTLDLLRRFVTYPFVHGSFTQALFAGALLLALGKFVGDVFRTPATLVLFFGSTIGGALVFGLIASGTSPLFSAFTPIYGLIGAYTYVVWLSLGQSGQNQLKAFQLIGFLLGIQLVFGLIFGAGQMWIAELSGFVIGFGLSVLLAPGGWSALLAKLRQR
ncbi:rhomboid family intramembrane serine protease [Yoonia sp. 208BN28-4]|uniref:rhomboid family intramembrane serine protease n=1 Tax=Yoonia sp. 208BN28-4 TaxID=3126505 RepID=UPI003094E348